MAKHKANRLDKKQNYELINFIRDRIDGQAKRFETWADAEMYFSKILGATVKRTNIASCLEAFGFEASQLVKVLRKSPIAHLVRRVDELEQRIKRLEDMLLERIPDEPSRTATEV